VQVKDQSKTAFSVMFCCSADGKLLPPMTMYKSPRGNIHGELSQQLTEQRKKKRYGEQKKTMRAGKSTRLPTSVSYTVSTVAGTG